MFFCFSIERSLLKALPSTVTEILMWVRESPTGTSVRTWYSRYGMFLLFMSFSAELKKSSKVGVVIVGSLGGNVDPNGFLIIYVFPFVFKSFACEVGVNNLFCLFTLELTLYSEIAEDLSRSFLCLPFLVSKSTFW